MDVFNRDYRIRIAAAGENRLEVSCAIDDPLHDLSLRLVVRLPELVLEQADLAVRRTPHLEVCRAIEPAAQRLVGLRIGAGFSRAVLRAVGGPLGCPNVVNMVLVAAPLAINSSWIYYESRDVPAGEVRELRERQMAGVCLAYPAGRENMEGR